METKLIRCCKCKDHKWNTFEDIIYTDVQKMDYCLFHAPKHKKQDINGKRISTAEFNVLFFAKVLKEHAKNNNLLCVVSGIIFPGDIDFTNGIKENLLYSTSLDHSVFNGKVSFRGFIIKDCTFVGTIFHGEANFINVTFEKDPNFMDAIFHRRANFSRAIFKKGASFISSTFINYAQFYKNIFKGRMNFNSIQAGDNAIRLYGLTLASLGNVLFTNLETSCFSFRECAEWPESFGFENEKETSLQYREELYRAMKQQALELHDQQQASHWHYFEKMMKMARQKGEKYKLALLRKYKAGKKKSWLRRCCIKLKLGTPHPIRSLTWWYWATSGFGERAVRAGVWLLALVGLSFLANSITEPWVWAELPGSAAAGYTMGTIPFAKDIPGDGWVKVGRGFWQLLIAVQFTLFALAVRNRFRR